MKRFIYERCIGFQRSASLPVGVILNSRTTIIRKPSQKKNKQTLHLNQSSSNEDFQLIFGRFRAVTEGLNILICCRTK